MIGYEVRIDWEPGTDTYAMRMFRRDPNGDVQLARITGVDDNHQPIFMDELVPHGTHIPATMILPWTAFDAMKRQFSKEAAPLNEVRDHRDDAIKVRDRLLSMLERTQ